MPELIVDRRDMEFVLYEQFDLEGLKSLKEFADFGRDEYDAVLEAAQKFIGEVIAPVSAAADAEAGATAVVQPGGSIRDDEVIAAADRLGLAMVLTGHRHFKH